MTFVGLDLHKRYITACALDASGAVLAEVRQTAMPSRPVDGQPVASNIRLLLGGTNLPAMDAVFDVLSRTGISPDLAPTILRGNADWVLAHLSSAAPMAPDRAHHLLVQLNRGTDLGRNASSWTSWVAGL